MQEHSVEMSKLAKFYRRSEEGELHRIELVSMKLLVGTLDIVAGAKKIKAVWSTDTGSKVWIGLLMLVTQLQDLHLVSSGFLWNVSSWHKKLKEREGRALADGGN